VKEDLAAAKVPVILYSLQNLPSSFDAIGSRLDNATLLHQAGVPVIFSDFEFAAHNARKVRQEAGNAVSHGLPWEAGLAGLTSAPAAALGLGDQLGRIEPGLIADLVLWDGDPLEVTTLAEQVWMRGRAMPMRSRQTELRDRYLQEAGALPRAYQR
jgi:imidazolonepropionase-like amidohydrolase